jgi:N-[(2S)-2-amino-2-carboxyethyl]-L-glutamate dehydrogenase
MEVCDMERKKVGFLFLSEPDMIKAGVLDTKKCVAVMDETFKLLGTGDYVMGGHNGSGHGCLLWFPKESPFPNMPLAGPDRRYMAMPAYLGGRFNMCGVKWYGSNIANPPRGYPRSILMLCLNDANTGEPRAIMSANLLSAMRTGSVPGVAAKYLARKGAESVGIVGCGVISRACARGILENMPGAKRMYLYDIMRKSAEKFAEELKLEYDVEMIITDTLEAAITDSDIISIAASGAVPVRIEKKWLKPGCLFTVTGHADVDDDCSVENRIVFDHWKMHKAWLDEGRMNEKGIQSLASWVPTYQVLKMYDERRLKDEDMLSLGDIAIGNVPARRNDKERIFFLSGGLPVEDVSWGCAMYEKAVEQGLGQRLDIWDQAHWL